MMRLKKKESGNWTLFGASRFWRRELEAVPVRKLVRDDLRVTLARGEGLEQVFVATSSAASEGIEGAVRRVSEAFQERGAEGIRLTFFVADPSLSEGCRHAAVRHWGASVPLLDVVPQPPADGSALAIEGWGVGGADESIMVEHPEPGLITISQEGLKWFHCGQIETSESGRSVYDQSMGVFESLSERLHRRGLGLEQVVRTWLYLGDIVGPEGETQRYKELNRGRSDSYAGLDFGEGWWRGNRDAVSYPASTGIGTEGRGLSLSAIALKGEGGGELSVVALENPRQTAAFDYAKTYSPSSPKFSRAMAVRAGSGATIFISGTASITASETQHLGDAAAQTHETLTNIEALISEENLATHGLPGQGGSLFEVTVARVYIKRPEDYVAVRAVCEERLGATPVCYTIADVCRPELLVEIEGIACTRGSGESAR